MRLMLEDVRVIMLDAMAHGKLLLCLKDICWDFQILEDDHAVQRLYVATDSRAGLSALENSLNPPLQ